jgi:hypothetical protein
MALLALLQRPGVALTEELPAVLLSRSANVQTPAVDREDLFSDRAIRVRQWRSGVLALIEIEPLQAFGKPDVLAYWSREDSDTSGGLPGNAFLLGPVTLGTARTFPLPRAALGTSGHLLLYSLGHAEVIGRAQLPESEAQNPAPPAAGQIGEEES